MARYGCAEEDVRNEVEHAGRGVRSDAMRRVLEHHGSRAHEFFSRARQALPKRDARSFVPDAGMTFNQILVDADEPLLFHTGMRAP